jgi:hypothetical protein
LHRRRADEKAMVVEIRPTRLWFWSGTLRWPGARWVVSQRATKQMDMAGLLSTTRHVKSIGPSGSPTDAAGGCIAAAQPPRYATWAVDR